MMLQTTELAGQTMRCYSYIKLCDLDGIFLSAPLHFLDLFVELVRLFLPFLEKRRAKHGFIPVAKSQNTQTLYLIHTRCASSIAGLFPE
jgi:hypothetical protein